MHSMLRSALRSCTFVNFRLDNFRHKSRYDSWKSVRCSWHAVFIPGPHQHWSRGAVWFRPRARGGHVARNIAQHPWRPHQVKNGLNLRSLRCGRSRWEWNDEDWQEGEWDDDAAWPEGEDPWSAGATTDGWLTDAQVRQFCRQAGRSESGFCQHQRLLRPQESSARIAGPRPTYELQYTGLCQIWRLGDNT